jgi:hypothetical protein
MIEVECLTKILLSKEIFLYRAKSTSIRDYNYPNASANIAPRE